MAIEATAPAVQTPPVAAPAAPQAQPEKPQAPPAPAPETPAKDAQEAKEAPKPDAPKEAPKTQDDVARELAKLNKELREVGEGRRKLAEERKLHAEKLSAAEQFEKVRGHLSKKEYVEALTVISQGMNVDLDEAAVLLVDQLTARERPLAPQDVEAITARKLAEAEAERVKKAEEAQQARITAAKATYGNAVVETFKSNSDKYPLITRRGVSDEALFAHVDSVFKSTGRAPDVTEALDHFEATYRAEFEAAAKALGYSKAEAREAAKDPPALRLPNSDTEGKATAPAPTSGETLREYDERVRRQLQSIQIRQ